jgi:hypothetical protein
MPMRRADHRDPERIFRAFVGAEEFRAEHLGLAVERDGEAPTMAPTMPELWPVSPPPAPAARLPGGRFRIHHRGDDLAVARAAAQHAAERILDRLLVRVRVSLQQRGGRDEKARRADAALRRAMAQEGGLQRREGAVRKPSTVRIALALGLGAGTRQAQTGLAVDDHRAGAAIAGVAADLGAGRAELVAQQRRQPAAGRDLAVTGRR